MRSNIHANTYTHVRAHTDIQGRERDCKEIKRCLLHSDVHWSIIHLSQDRETTNKWMRKKCRIYNMITWYSALEKEGNLAICDGMDSS